MKSLDEFQQVISHSPIIASISAISAWVYENGIGGRAMAASVPAAAGSGSSSFCSAMNSQTPDLFTTEGDYHSGLSQIQGSRFTFCG
jgi:hypothetical protein